MCFFIVKVYQLEVVQNLPISIDEAWDFFSNPKNLAKITPRDLDFQIQFGAEELMYEGQIIHYKLRPLIKIPVRWTTEICHVKSKCYFVDKQVHGPYSTWHHKHFFEEIEGGVKMRDLLHYSIPFGFFGRLINSLLVAKKVKAIFDYRYRILEDRFGKMD
jgi:ligand-binding SRPBCC domain-containing protein